MDPSKTLRAMFAGRFLKTLVAMRLRRKRCNSTFTARARTIKLAADISLASAATACNSKQAWSKAILRRSRAVLSRRRLQRQRMHSEMKRGSLQSRSDALHRLVPGGERMDLCVLLEEAADYIRALSAQVQVMQCISDSFTPSILGHGFQHKIERRIRRREVEVEEKKK